jgi:hypothetical protein
MSPEERSGADRPSDDRPRRRAEVVAGQCLDDAGPPAPDGEIRLEPPDRPHFVQHLFVHGLLTSLADEERNRSAIERERRVKGVMERIPPAGGAAITPLRARGRHLHRYAAAAIIVGILAVAGLFLVLDRGIQSEAAIDRALIHIRKGLDLQYRGHWYLEFDAGGKAVQRRFAIEFITGIDRFYMSIEVVDPWWGPVPFYFGGKGGLVWAQLGPFGPFDISEGFPGPMKGVGDPREFITALDSMLEWMRSFARLELTEPEEGVIRISGRPREDGETPFKMLDYLVIDLDRETFETKAFSVHLKPDLPEHLPIGPMMQRMDLPEGAKLEAIGFRLKLEKAFRAPAETYVPAELARDEQDE